MRRRAQSAAVGLERMVGVRTGGKGDRFNDYWRQCLERLKIQEMARPAGASEPEGVGGGTTPADGAGNDSDDLAELLALGRLHQQHGKNPAAKLLGD